LSDFILPNNAFFTDLRNWVKMRFLGLFGLGFFGKVNSVEVVFLNIYPYKAFEIQGQ